MKKKLFKAATLIMLSLSLLALAGCGKKATGEHVINKNAIYKETDLGIKFPEDMEVNNISISGDRIFAYGYSFAGDNYTQMIVSCNFDGSDMKTFGLGDNNSYVDTIIPMDNGNCLVMYNSYEEIVTEDSYDYNSYYYAGIFSDTGSLIKKVDLSENFQYASNIYLINNQIFIFADSSVYVLDTDLNQVKKKDFDDISINRVYTLKDGSYMVNYWGLESEVYKKFDPNTLEIGDDVNISINISNYDVMNGVGYDLFLKDTVSVYGYNVGDAEPTLLLNFVDSDIETSYFNTFTAIDDKTFIGAYYDYSDYGDDYVNAFKACKYEKVNPEDVVDKEVLTLGCLYLDSAVKKQVIDFNKKNDKYRIRVVDYSTYNTDEDWEAGTKKFNSDVASGKGPDIVIASDSSTVHNYISKGLYLDLAPYIEKDAEMNMSDFFPNIIEAGSSNGKLYELIPYFNVQTLVGKKSVLGDISGWNMAEMKQFESTLPSGTKLIMGMTREDFISTMLSVNSSVYVDMATGKCSFDSDDFKAILEYAKDLPVGDDSYYDSLEEEGYWESYETLWRSNKAVLMPVSLYSFSDYNQILKGYMGEDVSFVGYPSEDKQGSSIYYYFSIGISSKCASPDSAWEFVRTYMLPDYQKSITYGIPASLAAFDENAKKAQERNFYMDGDQKVYEDETFYVNGDFITIKPLTAEEVEKLKNFILTVTKVQGSLSDVETIIDEETQAYFAGEKSVDDVAKNIQGRVQIFISEKR